jgi:hypothetical protein
MTSTTNPYSVGYLFQAIIYGQGNPLKIYNNTFNFASFQDADLGVRSCIKVAGGTSDNIYLKNNNCVTGGKFALEVETSDLATSRAIAAKVNSDFNNWYGASIPFAVWTDYYYSLADWQAASYGQDANSKAVNPSFVSGPSNNQLAVGSVAIDNGATLGAPYNVDRLGVSRPQGAAWDIGAYEYASGGGGSPPASSGPTKIRPGNKFHGGLKAH